MNSILGIAASGMAAATRRLEASASNVANARSTGPLPAAGAATTAAGRPYTPLRAADQAVTGGGVRTQLVEANPASYAEYQPDSPDANADGMVAAPAVDLAAETVQQITARASFSASLKTAQAASDMMRTALDLKA